MLGVSTGWRSRSGRDGAAIVKDIAALKVKAVELDFRLNRKTLDEVGLALEETGITAVSIHAVLPAALEKPEGRWAERYFLCATDEAERKLAVKDIEETLKLAARMNVKAVVLHSGEAPMEKVTGRLQKMYDEGGQNSSKAKILLNKLRIERLQARGASFDMLLKSLEELNNIASGLNVFIGLENRYFFREYPNFEELAIIFLKLSGSHIKYWHDTGHAQAQENMGITPHEAYLKEFGDQMIGVHLHDVDGYSDHLAPPFRGRGAVDFAMVKKYLKPDVLRILEMRDGTPPEEAMNAVEWLQSNQIA
ncbi:hypothetical protein MNBD_NITROSPINAE02-1453 [hydrothermal vent metagenome]|uniref:Xylose isomerase-like TIM barrel domain-containing protein n=1 Tax=hydrothermal vent metagenome TaxID=652676 RepID=A0A3B1C856_9ZZZZ